MNSWTSEDAESRFGEVMDRALTDAPQTILTPAGKVAVVMNEADHHRLRGGWQRLLELDELPSEWLCDLWDRGEPVHDAAHLSSAEDDEEDLPDDFWEKLLDESRHCECCADGRGPPPVAAEEVTEVSGKSTDFWTAEETEGRAAEVMHRALTNAPQTVIRPDLTAIVVLSEKRHQRLLRAAQRLRDLGEDLPVPRKLQPGEPSLWDLLQSLLPRDENGEPVYFPEGFFEQMREEGRHCACCSQRAHQAHAAD
jgi:hypothetical protein